MILTDDMRCYIDAHRVARLATVDDGSQPHVVPFCYALMDDDLYFIVDDKPKRASRAAAAAQHSRPSVPRAGDRRLP